MAKLVLLIAAVAALVFAWREGWIARWFEGAVDSGIDSVKRTQREATKVRPADAPEEKK